MYCMYVSARSSYRIFWCVCVWGGEGGGGVVGYYHNVTHEFAAHVL